MQTNKILKIREDRDVLLRDKNNSMKWVNVKYLLFKYFPNLMEYVHDKVTNYLETIEDTNNKHKISIMRNQKINLKIKG